MISDKLNGRIRIVDCSCYIDRFAFKNSYHKKRMDTFAYTPVVFNYLETVAKNVIISARQNHPSKKSLKQCSSSSDCYSYEYKLR